jgi:hypothetical protein
MVKPNASYRSGDVERLDFEMGLNLMGYYQMMAVHLSLPMIQEKGAVVSCV